VVKVLDSYFILSVAENGISLIKEITSASEIEKLRILESAAPAVMAVSFQEQLRGSWTG